MVDRVVVSAVWLGDALNGSQTAKALRASTPGSYVMDLPTRQERRGLGRYDEALPRQLIVEIAPADADLVAIARDLIRQSPRWKGRCAFCDEPQHLVHIDDCLIAIAARHLALIEYEAAGATQHARRLPKPAVDNPSTIPPRDNARRGRAVGEQGGR